MKIKPLKTKLNSFAIRHNLAKKLAKQLKLLEENITHPSLNTEKLEPKEFRLYSFRIDRKYRAIFILLSSEEIEIIDINDHYQ